MDNDSCGTLVSIVRKHDTQPPDIASGVNATMPDLSRHCLDLLENVVRNGRALSPSLDDLLETLQESLMKFLHEELATTDVALTGRMHLHLSADGQLVVEGEENDSETLCKIASANPLFRQRFQKLSCLALLTAGIETACKAYASLHGDTDIDNAPFCRYHLCFKGALSHFFIK